MKNLKLLTIRNNLIQKLPASIRKLSELEILDISDNEFISIPSLKSLKKLKYLQLKNNLVAKFNSHIESTSNPSLLFLNLSSNFLLYFPDSLFNFPSLEILDLENNKISLLPDHFGDFSSSIQKLYLGSNSLSSLPSSFSNLSSLHSLFLSDNSLSKLPPSFPSLSLLEVFFLPSFLLFPTLPLFPPFFFLTPSFIHLFPFPSPPSPPPSPPLSPSTYISPLFIFLPSPPPFLLWGLLPSFN